MPSRDEIIQSLIGAWRLFLDRSDAMRYFDVSVDGFWRSFYAIVLILPAYVFIALAERLRILTDSLPDDDFDGGAFLVNKGLSLVLDWVTLPILLALLAGVLGIGRTYAAFIVARNWGAVLAIAPFGVIALLFLLGILGSDFANVASLVILVVVIRFNYLIARRALGVDVGFAVGLVVADFAVSLAVVGATDSLVGYGSSAL
jgi:hypothetical protein